MSYSFADRNLFSCGPALERIETAAVHRDHNNLDGEVTEQHQAVNRAFALEGSGGLDELSGGVLHIGLELRQMANCVVRPPGLPTRAMSSCVEESHTTKVSLQAFNHDIPS